MLTKLFSYLDSEQRIIAARVIKRFIMHSKKTAFIVEHDFIMATYLADRVIVFDGQPSVDARANKPESLLTGCNKFLKNLDVTFRRDPNSYRPRINKYNSQMDQEQKLGGNYVSFNCFKFSFLVSYSCSISSSLRSPLVKGGPKNDHHGNPDSPSPAANFGLDGTGVDGVRSGSSVTAGSQFGEDARGDTDDEEDAANGKGSGAVIAKHMEKVAGPRRAASAFKCGRIA